MRLTIDLHLKTRDVYRLFELKINDTRDFIDSVLRKINHIELITPKTHLQIERDLRSLISEFAHKTELFEKMLDNNRNIKAKAINITSQFHIKITITNKLGLLLVEAIRTYDNLIALIKLLHLAACFDSDATYYTNLKNVKKMGNKMLSNLLLLSGKKTNTTIVISLNSFLTFFKI